MEIAIINQSSKVDKKSFVAMVKACDIQLKNDASKAYGTAPSRVRAISNLKDAPNAYIIALIDSPDEADALGYHSETPDGRPYGKVFVEPILDSKGDLLKLANSVSVTLSHEVLELWWDPQINIWYQNTTTNELFAGEVCDPVEGDCYFVKVGNTKVAVSNFVLPGWFDANPEKGTVFDFCKILSKPFTMTKGGYVIKKTARGKNVQEFAKKYPDWKKKNKTHQASRTAKRTKKTAK